MHEGQLDVAAETVAALVAAQFPEWAGLAVRPVPAEGTVNALFQLGDGLVARLPLMSEDAGTVRDRLRAEAEAAAELHAHTTVATPEPLALGEPGAGYPLPWAVQTWVPGTTAWSADAAGSTAFAADLARLIGELRAVDTRGRTFAGDNRGGDLTRHDDWMATCLTRSAGLVDVDALGRLWARLRELPRTTPDAMCHGDLIGGNVLVNGDRLTGVIDTGGFEPADPALDLVAAWHLLDEAPRAVLRDALGSDDLEWARGAAWALEQAMGVVWYYADSNPVMSRMGHATIERLLAAAPTLRG